MSGNAHVRFGGAGWGNLRPETVAWRPAPTLLRPLAPDQAADLLEVIEDRSQLRSTIVTSQLPVAHWHEALGEATVADAILDRLLQNANRIELAGESLRRPVAVATVTAGADSSRENGPARATTPKSARRSENRAAETAVEAR